MSDEIPKYTGEIYLVTSDASKEVIERAQEAGINEVFAKTGSQRLDDLFTKQGRRNVAVVDDHPLAARGNQVLLESEGANVVIYFNPLTALKEIPTHMPAFDVVFTDNKMPKMTGIELASRLRTGDRSNLP